MEINKIYRGSTLDVLKTFPDESVDCFITSPPYWGLRDYGIEGQLGLEKTPEEYVAKMVLVFREVKRVLKKEVTLWLNLVDSYVSAKSRYSSVEQTIAGKSRGEPIDNNRPDLRGHKFLKDKDLSGIPWRVAFALQADGWYLRQDIIWAKPNPMPESVTDRCTKSHEYIFLMSKSPNYYFDNEAIKEPAVSEGSVHVHKDGNKTSTKKDDPLFATKPQMTIVTGAFRNRRSVWTIVVRPSKEAHFATFPEQLIQPMILAGCPKGGTVLDPFMGSGTTAVVAERLNRQWIGIELNPEYIKIAEKRIATAPKSLFSP